jgi:serine/threonine-protein kinase
VTGAAESRELAPGDALGGYRLEDRLGEGGMGLVFRAVREADGEVVALKVTKLAFADDEDYRRRFVHEARAAADVHHPNLVPILDAGDADGREFIAVQYVEGPTLQESIEREGVLDVEQLVDVARGLGGGLDALHERGIVHRDIKASNVLFANGVPLLTDFGLAKGPSYTVLTKPGQVLGTLEYLAPELIRGEPATAASDVYAFGCLLYQCVAGRTPFGDRSLFAVGIAHLDEEPADPAAGRAPWPEGLSAALLAALRKDAADRPASAGAYAALVERAAA